MLPRLIPLFLLLGVMSSIFVFGATIKGSAFDEQLTLLNTTVISLNTTPEQRLVSIDGTYSFDVPKGKYVLRAFYDDGVKKLGSEKAIVITAEGEYTIDLILTQTPLQLTPEEQKISPKTNESNVTAQPPAPSASSFLWWIAIVVLLVGVVLGGYVFWKRRKRHQTLIMEPLKSEQELELENLLVCLKTQGGRMYQKEIRKYFPQWSEAKISLMIAQLETQNKIKKIKKGRANILFLQP